MVRPAAQRKAVEHVRQLFEISERRACSILGVDRSSMRYAHRRGDDGDLRSRLREIALERRWFGYRRLGIMLAREGLVMNHKKLLRLYREETLRVRRRRGRKRAMGTRAPIRCRKDRTSAGGSTSSATRWFAADVSASLPSSMTSRGRISRWWSIRRYRAPPCCSRARCDHRRLRQAADDRER